MSVRPLDGEPRQVAVTRIDREFAGIGAYRVYNTGLPGPWSDFVDGHQADLIVSFKASPRGVLNGRFDGFFRQWFAAAPTDRRVFWTFFHEPEDEIEDGQFTAAQFRRAFNHLIALADEHGAKSLTSTLILMSYSLEPQSMRDWKDYYPGPSVDVVAWDAYNRPTAQLSYASPQAIYGDTVAASRSVGKPFAVAETGSLLAAEDPTGQGRATWLREQVVPYLSRSGAVFAAYFNSTVGGDYRLLDAPSQDAWREAMAEGPSAGVGHDPGATVEP